MKKRVTAVDITISEFGTAETVWEVKVGILESIVRSTFRELGLKCQDVSYDTGVQGMADIENRIDKDFNAYDTINIALEYESGVLEYSAVREGQDIGHGTIPVNPDTTQFSSLASQIASKISGLSSEDFEEERMNKNKSEDDTDYYLSDDEDLADEDY